MRIQARRKGFALQSDVRSCISGADVLSIIPNLFPLLRPNLYHSPIYFPFYNQSKM